MKEKLVIEREAKPTVTTAGSWVARSEAGEFWIVKPSSARGALYTYLANANVSSSVKPMDAVTRRHCWRIIGQLRAESMLLRQFGLHEVFFKTRHEAALALAIALDLDGYEVVR